MRLCQQHLALSRCRCNWRILYIEFVCVCLLRCVSYGAFVLIDRLTIFWRRQRSRFFMSISVCCRPFNRISVSFFPIIFDSLVRVPCYTVNKNSLGMCGNNLYVWQLDHVFFSSCIGIRWQMAKNRNEIYSNRILQSTMFLMFHLFSIRSIVRQGFMQ